jgi:hypothetical protein
MQASKHHECNKEKERLENTQEAIDAFDSNSAHPSNGEEDD